VAPAPLVVHTEASRGFGGQELRILGETRWLLAHGWRALIIAQPGSRLLEEAHDAALPAVAVGMRHPLDLSAVLALRRLLRGHDARLVHTHSSIDSWVGGLAGRALGLAVVRGRHVSIRVPRRRALVYRLAHRIITSGEGVKAVLVAAGLDPSRITTVASGVDLARFHASVSGARVRSELGLEGPVAGLVANIRGSKGHDVFLAAAREVLATEPRARFLIVGDGIGFQDVKAKVRAQGLERSVTMTGFRRDVPEVMAALDVLVLPSIRSEAISQVLPQAMALGTPVVASRMGGSPEIVKDGDTGRLVPPGDAPALAAAILASFGDPAGTRAMAQRAQVLVQRRFSFDAQMEVTAGVYRELLAARR
jgi:glycosyltransferase involved in cell wall biosynthesis